MNAAHFQADPLRAPATIADYLDRLRAALAGADPALVQDALYDAEDYLRSEMAANPGRSEAEVIAEVAGSYGAPDEVADIYRDTEVRVQTALQPPKPRKPRTPLGRFFGVALEPRTYAALFYMLLSMATGIFYFTWIVTGASMSVGLSVLIIGIPFLILFLGSVRVLSLVEGRLVEVMLGERMPRRPTYVTREGTVLQRIGAMFTDPRTWGTMVYMLLMLPLGILYFSRGDTAVGRARLHLRARRGAARRARLDRLQQHHRGERRAVFAALPVRRRHPAAVHHAAPRTRGRLSARPARQASAGACGRRAGGLTGATPECENENGRLGARFSSCLPSRQECSA